MAEKTAASDDWISPDLSGRVALVAGATRGAGRGMAIELGAAGATVYCTGRSVRGQPSDLGRPETIEETAELVTQAGGLGIPVRVDHTVPREVEAVFARLAAEREGRLDVLIVDIWGGDMLQERKPFWEHSLEKGFEMLNRGIRAHIITSHFGVPLMVARGSGLVIEIGDGDGFHYRGNLFYDLAKVSAIRLGFSMAVQLGRHGVTALTLTPGFLRSENVLDHFGVTEANWRDAIEKDPHFADSETPRFIGRAVVSLAGDPDVRRKAGRSLATWTLAPEYGFTDVDGTQPNWGQRMEQILARA